MTGLNLEDESRTHPVVAGWVEEEEEAGEAEGERATDTIHVNGRGIRGHLMNRLASKWQITACNGDLMALPLLSDLYL